MVDASRSRGTPTRVRRGLTPAGRHFQVGGSLAATPSAYAAAVLLDTPLAYWPLTEPSGTVMADASGNGRDGTYVGAPTLGAASLGGSAGSVDFAGGSTQYGTVPEAAWMHVPAFTAECLIRPSASGGGYVFARDESGSNRMWNMLVGGDATFYANIFDSGAAAHLLHGAAGAQGWALNTVYHLALTFDASAFATLWRNGVAIVGPTLFPAVSPGSGRISVARTYNDAANFFPGRISDAAFYDHALSSARILAHAQAAGLA